MSFAAPIFTAAGRALQVRALAGEELRFTKIGIGDGELSQSIEGLTTLINSVINVDISFANRSDTTYTVGGAFTNAGITTGFYWRELGLYAADPDYPDDRSKDILYIYQNAANLAEYIASGSSSVIEKSIRISAVVGNADNVTAEISSSTVFVTQKEFSEHTHSIGDVDGLQTTLDNKAPSQHDHNIDDVSGLQTALDNKSATNHTHKASEISGLPTSLPADGGNADSVGGYMPTQLMRYKSFGNTKTSIYSLIDTGVYHGSALTDYPADAPDGQGTVIVINYKLANNIGSTLEQGVDGLWLKRIYIAARNNNVWEMYVNGTTVYGWERTKDGGIAEQVKTAAIAHNNYKAYYPTFVDSNNAAATAEAIYSTVAMLLGLQLGTTSVVGKSILSLGNIIPSGTANNAYGALQLCNDLKGYTNLRAATGSNALTEVFLPPSSGKLATMASGTAVPDTTNCPVGGWYGQHE